jgi:hypothetical protein
MALCLISQPWSGLPDAEGEDTIVLPNSGVSTPKYQIPFLTANLAKKETYMGADKSVARPTSRGILFDGENISFVPSLVICINSTNIPPIMIINRMYENQNLLSL